MFCPSCGNPNPENVTQCQRCGTALQQSAPKPQKFKGTMMMASSAELLQQIPGAPAAGGVPGAPQGAFARTVAGGIPAFDPGESRPTNPDDLIDGPTIMQAPGSDMPSAGFGPPRAAVTQPQGTANVNATMAMDASAFGVTPHAPQSPVRAPEPAPETGSSTVAVDASAFGLGGPMAPQGLGAPGAPPQGPGPSPWGAPPAQQPPPQQPPPPPQQQPEISTGGVASTVAVDISQFGLGGGPGGAPNPYGAPPGPPQGGPPQGYGGYPQQPGMNPGMQPGMNPGMQPGMNPGMNPGMQHGMQPGMQPGAPQGWNPQGMSPLQPPPAPAPSGGNKTLLIAGLVVLALVILAATGLLILMRR